MKQNQQSSPTRPYSQEFTTGRPSRSEAGFTLKDGAREMEVLKEQLSIVVHELRTPLALIVGHAGLLQRNLRNAPASPDLVSEDKNEEKSTVRSIEAILHQTGQMSHLINQLYDFSELETWQLEAGNRRNIELSWLIKQVVNEQSLIHPTHFFRLVPANKRIELVCDSRRIEQVLNNLINNAIKYSPVRSEVTVGYETTDDGTVTVWVRDQGWGIRAEEQERIFEQFCRGNEPEHSQKEGLGLGLYICRSIVQQHKGQIWLESRVGEGSTFYFSLPTHN